MKYVNNKSRILNWPEMPLTRIVILLILGIYASQLLSIPIIYQISTCSFLFVVVMILNLSKSSDLSVVKTLSLLILFLIFCIGFLRNSLEKTSNDKYHYSHYISKQNYIEGQLIQDIKKKTASYSSILAVKNINGLSVRGKLLVYFNKRDSLLDYSLGDIIAISGSIINITSSKNPRCFDYQKYMANKGVVKQIFLKTESHSLIKKDRIFTPLHYAHQTRNWASRILKRRLPDNNQYATASAMVLGNREHINDELLSAFSDTGAVHVLAVSGLHVGIVIMLFNFLFRKTRSESNQSKKVIKFTVLTCVVVMYALITGASPAVVRASIMFSTLLFGRLWFDNTNIYNILSFSAILILLYNPNYLTDLGFIFSYLALISIVFFQPYFMRLIELLYEPTHWISIRLVQLVSVSLAAQVLIFPLSIYYFHKFPTYFVLSGVFAVAMAPFILGCGLLLISTSFIPIWSSINTICFSLLLKAFLGIIYGIQKLPFNSVENVWISKSSMIFLYLAIASIMYILANKKSEYHRFLNPNKTGRNRAVLLFSISISIIMINSIYYTYRIKNQEELIIYDYQNGTLIDIFEGDKLTTISSKNIDEKKLEYTCKNNRIYHGGLFNNPINKHYAKDQHQKLSFAKKNILFLHALNIDGEFPKKSDILLISHGCKEQPYKILDVHITKLVILDSSTTYKVLNLWRKECKKKAIPFYSTKKEGAYILKP